MPSKYDYDVCIVELLMSHSTQYRSFQRWRARNMCISQYEWHLVPLELRVFVLHASCCCCYCITENTLQLLQFSHVAWQSVIVEQQWALTCRDLSGLLIHRKYHKTCYTKWNKRWSASSSKYVNGFQRTSNGVLHLLTKSEEESIQHTENPWIPPTVFKIHNRINSIADE